VVVSVFQLAPDQYLKPGPLAPFDSVRRVANDGFENTSIILVATESRRFRVFRNRRVRLVVVLILRIEEPAPRFTVFANDLLSGGRIKNAFVFAFETACIGVPHVIALEAVLVVVPHEAFVIDLIPESGGSVQQVP
jgi:hypothetical protein